MEAGARAPIGRNFDLVPNWRGEETATEHLWRGLAATVSIERIQGQRRRARRGGTHRVREQPFQRGARETLRGGGQRGKKAAPAQEGLACAGDGRDTHWRQSPSEGAEQEAELIQGLGRHLGLHGGDQRRRGRWPGRRTAAATCTRQRRSRTGHTGCTPQCAGGIAVALAACD